jgi:hypothetical protein
MGFSLKKMFSPVTKIVKKATGAVSEVTGEVWDGVKNVGSGIQSVGSGIRNIGGSGVDIVQGLGTGSQSLLEGVGSGIGGGVETLGKENPTLLAGIATGNPALLAAGTQLETQKLDLQYASQYPNDYYGVNPNRSLGSNEITDGLFDEKYTPYLIFGGTALIGILLYKFSGDQ